MGALIHPLPRRLPGRHVPLVAARELRNAEAAALPQGATASARSRADCGYFSETFSSLFGVPLLGLLIFPGVAPVVRA